jgi:hypothetical protein
MYPSRGTSARPILIIAAKATKAARIQQVPGLGSDLAPRTGRYAVAKRRGCGVTGLHSTLAVEVEVTARAVADALGGKVGAEGVRIGTIGTEFHSDRAFSTYPETPNGLASLRDR